MSTTYAEVILETWPGADRDHLSAVLRQYGFDPLPMTVGVLLSDHVEKLRALWPTLAGTEAGDLVVPDVLKTMVRAARIAKPRSFHM